SRPWLDAIEVRHGAADGDGVTSTLESCRDYLDVAGMRVRPTVGGTTALIFQARALGCQTKALILTAQPAAVSYLRPLAFDEDLPDRLPWQVAMILSGAEA